MSKEEEVKEVNVDKWLLRRSKRNHIEATLAPGIMVGFRLYREGSQKWTRGFRAYMQWDVETELGTLRGRDVKIVVRGSDQQLRVHWPQFDTGWDRSSGPDEEMKPEYLDVVGPKTGQERRRWNGEILKLYHQIREEEAAGTLPPERELPEDWE